jgi:oligopeptide transport system substrate-binding protein
MRNPTRRFPVLAVAVAALAVLATACGRGHAPSDVLRRGALSDPATLDPQRAAEVYSYEVLRDLFEGLTVETPEGNVAPGVARDWSVDATGRRYQFVLRPDARWSNGDPVVAADFVAGLRRAVDPKTASPGAELLELIDHAPAIVRGREPVESLAVRAEDPQHLEIVLRQPAPFFAGLLANAVADPVHGPTLTRYGAEFARPGRLVSNGAYRLLDQVAGAVVRLERNPAYWDAAHVAVRVVEYLPIADIQAQLLRYRSGGLEMTDSMPAAQLAWARERLPAELQIAPQLSTVYFAFNRTAGVLAPRRELAEALSLALDREALTEKVLRGGQVPAYSFVPPGMPGYTPQVYPWAGNSGAERLQRAQGLLRAAGYSPAHPLHLRILYNQNDTIRNLAVAAAAQWRTALGVEAEFVDLEFRAFLAARTDRSRWDVVVAGWNADYADPGNFLNVFRTGAPQNDPGLSDPEYDGLLDTASNEPDPAARLAELAVAERRLLASSAVAPVYFAVSRRLVKAYVSGALLNPMNHNYSKYLALGPRPAPGS